jgi:hypothetical protein
MENKTKFVYMIHRAVGYLDAAECVYIKQLENEVKNKYHLIAPTIYLIGHSVELALKSVLFLHDNSVDLRGYSHKLKCLWNDSKKHFSVNESYNKIEIIVDSYAPIYPQDLRYPDKQGTTQTLVDFDSYKSSSSDNSDIIMPDLAISQVNHLIQTILKDNNHVAN